MKKFAIKLTKEQREQIKKQTGASVKELSLLSPMQAEKKVALRASPQAIKALRSSPQAIKALRSSPQAIKALRSSPQAIKALRSDPLLFKAK